MSLARTTIGITRAFEGLLAGKPGRRGVLTALLSISGILVIALGLVLMMSDQPRTPALAIGGLLGTIAVFAVMLIKHEWLLISAIFLGHTIFYGRFPSQLGLRIKNTIGPAEILFFLAFVAALIYWWGQKDRPTTPKALLVPPILLFVYTAAYVIIAFFVWERQDNALVQPIGWLYFTVAIPAYLCLAAGRIWKPFLGVIFIGLLLAGTLSFFLEAGVFMSVIERTGYGGLGPRSFGDMTARTNALALAVYGTLLAIVVVAYAKTWFWKYLSIIGGLSGAMVMFLDRGRATYAGMLVAFVLLLIFLPNPARLRFSLRGATAIAVGVLIIIGIGGEVNRKFSAAWEKATVTVELTSRQAITADPGIVFRQRQLRQANAIWQENLLFGGGPGIFLGTEMDWKRQETMFVAWIDNSILYPLAVGGLVGYSLIWLCYICFLGLSLWAFLRLRHPFHRALAVLPFAHFSWLLVCIQVNWWLVERFHIAAFSLGVALALALVHHEKVHGSEKAIIETWD